MKARLRKSCHSLPLIAVYRHTAVLGEIRAIYEA